MKFDGPWAESTLGAENKYRYNGKELVGELGLNWYAYGARYYDAAIGRFTGVDPISDQFPWVSTYNYAENEPIRNIDLHGLQKADGWAAQGAKKWDNVKQEVRSFFGFDSSLPTMNITSIQEAERISDNHSAVSETIRKVQENTDAALGAVNTAGEILETGGDATMLTGVGLTLLGAPEIGIPMVVAGSKASDAGAAAQMTVSVLKGDTEGAVTKAVVEGIPMAVGGMLTKATKSSTAGYISRFPTKEKQLGQSQQVLETVIQQGTWSLEQALDQIANKKKE